MTVYRRKDRGNALFFEFEYSGKRYKGKALNQDGSPCASDKEAKAAERRKLHELESAPPAHIPRPDDYTLAMAFNALRPKWEREPGLHNKQRAVEEILEYFGGRNLMCFREIGEQEIDDYVNYALARPIRQWFGGTKLNPWNPANERFWKTTDKTRAAKSQNVYMSVLSAAFKEAGKRRDRHGNFVFKSLPRVRYLKTIKREADPIPDEAMAAIIPFLPDHAKDAVAVSVLFGLRENEVFKLKIRHVDFQRGGIKLKGSEVKEKRDALQQGGANGMALLAHLIAQARERGVEHLITWRRSPTGPYVPLTTCYGTYRAAMKKAGIEKRWGQRWRWHDIRAAYISRIANAPGLGGGPMAAMTMARHTSFSTTQLYIKGSEPMKKAAAKTVAESGLAKTALKALGVDFSADAKKGPPRSPPRQMWFF